MYIVQCTYAENVHLYWFGLEFRLNCLLNYLKLLAYERHCPKRLAGIDNARMDM